ncbi:phospholipase A1 VesT1.02 [Bombyx mori]|uniref:Lipase domain-containing protein n=1 Tax=Bombyx mori TaxID=7091 RepID=A0A8R1WJR4_BOMMO|nr:phospholipase A1 VesT1.02 [Bombyx mori]
MKTFFCLAVCFFVCVSGWGRGDLEKFGPFQLALRSGLLKCNHNRNLNLDVSGIDVYFYDFSKNEVKTFTIDEAANGILSYPKLDKNKKFITFVGGFKSQIHKRTEEQIRDAFRTVPNSYLIMLDHSLYTNNKQGNRKSYERSVKYVHYIGKALGQMLVKIRDGGVTTQKMHCIGHSLGAQILGHAGDEFMRLGFERIQRITALDPAGPCFSNSFIEEQVRAGVAKYVEVYHCNAGGLGSSSVLGDVDFFINKNGQTQPNCSTPWIPGIFDSPKAASCNHRTCIDIWTASVRHPEWFPAWKCNSYKDFKKGRCATSEMSIAGYWNPGNATGIYYFKTDGYNLSS